MGRDSYSYKIFRRKCIEESEVGETVQVRDKYISAVLLLLLHVFFITYSVLKAAKKGYEWQVKVIVTFIIELAIEVLVVSTLECVFIYVILPYIASDEVSKAKEKVSKVVDEVCMSASSVSSSSSEAVVHHLAAPWYLFVSSKVSHRCPELVESMLVLSYRSFVPSEHMSRSWRSREGGGDNRGGGGVDRVKASLWTVVAVLVYVLQLVLLVPFVVHKLMIRILIPSLLLGLSLPL